MSRSYHVNSKTFRNCSKRELEEQAKDPNSQLTQWAEKMHTKRKVKEARKSQKEAQQAREAQDKA
jgi:hypothetical protein